MGKSPARTAGSSAVKRAYPRDITKWQVATVPSESEREARMDWLYAAQMSGLEWRVYTKGNTPQAGVRKRRASVYLGPFTPEAEIFRDASARVAVDGGWLIGINQGEFGGGLYWFSRDGKHSYKISDHHVVDFFTHPNGVHAIEGWHHIVVGQGSVIRIARPKARSRWQATSVVQLPDAPYCYVPL